jgi:hypothetical protein
VKNLSTNSVSPFTPNVGTEGENIDLETRPEPSTGEPLSVPKPGRKFIIFRWDNRGVLKGETRGTLTAYHGILFHMAQRMAEKCKAF